jgi:Protein of unknown function (DUF4232)
MSTRLCANRVFVSGVTAVVTAAVATAALAGCGSVQAPGGAAAATAATGPGGSTAPGGTASPGGTAGTASPSGPASLNGTASASASASASGSAAAATCAAAGLRVRLDTAVAGVAAGTYYVPLEFTNTSAQACLLAGYPAVAFTSGAAGQQIGSEAAVDRSVRTTDVLLAPGATAHAWLQVLDAANYPASKCHPVTAAGLRVVAPGSESASYLPHRVPACKAAISGSQILVVHPVQDGRAQRGTA